jgi:cyclic beta-1,2-glucan synthetase
LNFSGLRAIERPPFLTYEDGEDLIRAELFSIERLAQHAHSLAEAQTVSRARGSSRKLEARLRDNDLTLRAAYRSISEAIQDGRTITPAAEWLIDNSHVVAEQIREIRASLPPGYYRQLPKLAGGPFKGYPRVFGLAWAFVAHTDSRFDPAVLCQFVRAYQQVQPLTIGELWAVAITLRIVLVENLRRAADGIARHGMARREADALADRLLGVGGHAIEPDAMNQWQSAQAPLPVVFAVQLVQRLRDQDPTVTPAVLWLEERLAAQGTTADEIVRGEHQRQGATNITMRNIITSMRLISAVDWADLFEDMSLVDATLRAGSNFAAMDFQTRNRYRSAIEELARGSNYTEQEIAERAVRAAHDAGALPSSDDHAVESREQDPGYYLISRGRRTFEAELDFHGSMRDRLFHLNARSGIALYLAMIAILTAVILTVPLLFLSDPPIEGWKLLAFGLLGSIPASDAALALVNRMATSWYGPKTLPGLDLREGVPAGLRTMIVVPTMLTNPAAIQEQIERLEVHHLASPDGDLYFALLSDWSDAEAEAVPGDDELLAAANTGIEELNRRHGPAPGGDRFIMLHRRRLWNAGEGKWIGWERKRGKLHELNRLLRGATDTTFLPNEARVPTDVRYVVTLDADTRLPRGATRRLIGKIAHPLNRPRFDRRRCRVVEGHAILQPRVTPSLPIGREGSLFQRVFSSPSGLDPYAFAVSDVYQDLFGEGSYCGKGIYDVDAFEAALEGRIPENTVLSHDLLEGIFARAALASDVEVVEEFPSRYDVAAARQHRWVRGDWQLLPWIFGRGKDRIGGRDRIAIPMIGRWKMLDNLRRSAFSPLALLGLLLGWTMIPDKAELWTAFILGTIALPALLPLISTIVPNRRGISLRHHFMSFGRDCALALIQIAFHVTFLAHQALLMVDAIVRTLFRVLIHKRSLLEWVTAAQAKYSLGHDLRRFWLQMAGSIGFAVTAAVLIHFAEHQARLIASPFLVLWMFSPAVARWASLPPPLAGHLSVSAGDTQALRLIARRTWRFFEKFIGPDDHMLPPDNFQEDPNPVVAHRTSPTNIGLYLLSVVSAYDFGWMGLLETIERLEATLGTMNRLERFRGHFFNWYDTRAPRPLEPKYISSVDSGNLAGHLIALANAARGMIERPITGPHWAAGIRDALARRTRTVPRKHLEDGLLALDALLENPPATPAESAGRLADLMLRSDTIVDIARTLAEDRGDATSGEMLAWAKAMDAAVRSHQRDVERLMPWAGSGRIDALLPDADAASRQDLGMLFESIPTLADLPDLCEAAIGIVTEHRLELATRTDARGDSLTRAAALIDALERSASAARSVERRLVAVSHMAREMFEAMEFDFLFEPERQLLSIGYRVSEGSLDSNCYDLLASEARLASFIAIAKGDVPARHWFRLGRTLTPVAHGSVLISWSGSMFEYLMPSLVMRAPVGSLLEQTNRLVVHRQITYGAELGVPWGMSESEFNSRDMEFTYQYFTFGIPDLAYKRGLAEDTVIAPYATGLAAMVDPKAVVENFSILADVGGRGSYGWYESLDFTRARLPKGERVAVVRAYMAHHQAMIVVAIGNALHDGAMRTRFHAEPIIQATELLLQERMPRDVTIARPTFHDTAPAKVGTIVPPMQRRYRSPNSRLPHTHLLSNGRYAVMLTNAGSGYSHWRDLAITRWREDVTCDSWGSYIFLRDVGSGALWSAGYQPTGAEPDSYEAAFSEDRAEFVRHDAKITTTLEIVVSPEDDGEVRRVSVVNLRSRAREIELTSYSEIVLAPDAADASHPVYSKMFVQTEFVAGSGALLATRRRQSAADPQPWVAHIAVVDGEAAGETQFETDRARFLGRGQGIHTPVSMADGWPLSNTVGTVLDPIFSLRTRVRLAPGATAHIAFWTLVGASRDEVLSLVEKHSHAAAFERAATLAWTQAQVQLHHLGITPDEAHLFQRLANRVIYSDPTMRPSSNLLMRGGRARSGLWALGISGDLPIVVLRFEESDDLEIVRQLLRAHEYWRMKQLAVDLVLLNERAASYVQDLQTSVEAIVRASHSPQRADADVTRGGVFTLRADVVPMETRELLQTAARVVLLGRRGSLSEQLVRLDRPTAVARPPVLRARVGEIAVTPALRPQLEFFNGLGGFSPDGREYVTVLDERQWTPAPWINVIANPGFGFQVSVEGAGYSWSGNSRENQITPWSNDPVSDTPGEVLYLRDEESGALWGPTALPIREPGTTYVARHGQGYSRFEHDSQGISLELLQYVPGDDPIKISRLRIHNTSGRTRQLSVTAYVEWALGPSRSTSSAFVSTEIDADTKAILARNPWNLEAGSRVAFMDLAGRQSSWTGDRTEFLGRNGTLDRPAALDEGTSLSNRVGAGLDPCGALQTRLDLKANVVTEIVLLVGQGASKAEAQALIAKYRAADLDAVLAGVNTLWDDVLGGVQVKTPDRSMDVLLNRWLLYQTLSCRVWARTGFYQASGAYGFRDQLQDVMALVSARPDLTRAHLLRAAGRQFAEGDVQHWWLPPSGRGVRTHFSDDQIWLPYAVAHYIEVTNDTDILDEKIPFLDGPVLKPHEHESFFQPTTADNSATLYEHCALALDTSLSNGQHGLPLIGTGDWNDGMNRVGAGGKGESVWLGWFLYATIGAFSHRAEARGDSVRAANWRTHAAALRDSIEREAWDGDWYRRGYFDDGSPLGSVSNSECRIDSIAQSWAVISQAADPARAARAMAAVDKYLVRRDDGVALLFTPPFDHTASDPGRIKGYPPGLRENGGQYTHGAIWSVIAFAMLGDGDKAAELFSLLNPVNHASSRAAIHRYKVEPYVVAADVYSVHPHIGRGGWTWYTGSAGWMYRAGLESILGFRLRGDVLHLDPCVPRTWPGFEIVFRYRTARYEIAVENPNGASRGIAHIELDGTALEGNVGQIALKDDGATHLVRLTLG